MTPRPGQVKEISSPGNPVIKAVRALHLRKARTESGLFLAEGAKLVIDAVDAGWPPTMLLALKPADDGPVARLAVRVRALGADIAFVTPPVMEKIARRDNPQTVMGVFEQRLAPLSRVVSGTVVALEAPRDPGNVGTIVRTADAVGASAVVLVGASADPFGVEAVRATMGSIFTVPVVRTEADAFEAFASAFPGPMIGAHLAGAADIRTVTPREPQILLMGTEQSGLSGRLAARCDTLARIPMAGRADSFNLAIATALALYELRRPFL